MLAKDVLHSFMRKRLSDIISAYFMNKTILKQNAYHVLADYYDELMSEKKYVKWRQLINEVVIKNRIPINNCIDVACGTGNITKILSDIGFKVTGIDRSREMLQVAKKRFPDQQFIQSDIRNFSIKNPEKYNFAVSFYDSLNYLLTDKDMLSTFHSVNKNLAPGAIFLFDMNTREHVYSSQKNNPKINQGKNYYSVFKFSGEKRIWFLDIDFFVKKRNGLYNLISEHHVERGYNRKDIEPLLQKAGFDLIDFQIESKTYEDGPTQPSRLYFISKKK